MAMLFELARNLEKSTGDSFLVDDMRRKSDISPSGSSAKKLELSPTKSSALVDKVDGSGFSEPEWEPEVNLGWTTRQVTEELWRTWNGKDSALVLEASKEGDEASDLDDLPPPPPPPPLPPPESSLSAPPGKLDVVPDVLPLSSGLGMWQGDAFNLYSAGQFVPTLMPLPPIGMYAPPPEFYGIGATFDHVNEPAIQPRYWHESTFNTFGRDSRRKQESLIDLAAARQHIEQQLQQQRPVRDKVSMADQGDQSWQQGQASGKQPNFCTFCGGKIQPSSKFCIFCGSATSLSAC